MFDTEHYWDVHDYVLRELAYICTALCVNINKRSGKDPDKDNLKGFKFKAVFNDEFETVKPTEPITVDLEKRKATLSFNTALFKESIEMEWAKGLIKGFFDVEPSVIKDPVKFILGDEALIDEITFLYEKIDLFSRVGIHTVHFTNFFDVDDTENIETFLNESLKSATEKADYID